MGKNSDDVYVEIKVMPLDQLVHNERNPRYIKSKKHRELMDSLKEFPEMKLIREIVIDENNLLLAGDKRVYALEELGYSDVTVKQVFNLTDEQKDEFIAKDNIHNGEWDSDKIANEWDADKLQNWGVPKFKLGGDPGGSGSSSGYKPHEVTCPECGHHFELSEQE